MRAALQCAPCSRKGHVCYADRVDEDTKEAICVFCLDSEPCIWEQRNKNSKPAFDVSKVPTSNNLPQKKSREAEAAGGRPARRDGSTPSSRSTSPEVPMAKRICEGFEKACTNEISERNTTGLCTRCYARKNYREHHPSAKPRNKARSANGHVRTAKSNGVAPPQNGRVTLELNEEQLNRFLISLPLDNKQRLMNAYLRGEE